MKEEILKRLDGLAATLKTTTEALWVILVQQAKIEAWYALFCIAATLVLMAGAAGFLKWAYTHKFEDCAAGECAQICGWFLVGFGWAVGIICTFVNAYTAFICFSNPNYWALQTILDTLKGK